MLLLTFVYVAYCMWLLGCCGCGFYDVTCRSLSCWVLCFAYCLLIWLLVVSWFVLFWCSIVVGLGVSDWLVVIWYYIFVYG